MERDRKLKHRWRLLGALIGLIGLTACDEKRVVYRVAVTTDTTVKVWIHMWDRNGRYCEVARSTKDTARFTVGDTVNCNWSVYVR